MCAFPKSTGVFPVLVLQRDDPLVVVKSQGHCAAAPEKTCPFVFECVITCNSGFVVVDNLVEQSAPRVLIQ